MDEPFLCLTFEIEAFDVDNEQESKLMIRNGTTDGGHGPLRKKEIWSSCPFSAFLVHFFSFFFMLFLLVSTEPPRRVN